MNVLVSCSHAEGTLDLERVRQTALFALAALDAPETAEVSVSFVDDGEMASLNEEYRGKQGPTDVLSFECDNLDDGFPVAEEDVFELGDVVIAPDVAARQAADAGCDYLDEVDMLVVHGVLHLNGYDHVDPADAEVMEPLQDDVLRRLRESREA